MDKEPQQHQAEPPDATAEPIADRVARLESQLANYKHAFETTETDRDRISDLLGQADAKIKKLQDDLSTARADLLGARREEDRRASEAVADMAKRVETLSRSVTEYKHAFDTTAADRDRLASELDAVDGRFGKMTQALFDLAFSAQFQTKAPRQRSSPPPMGPPALAGFGSIERAHLLSALKPDAVVPNLYCVGAPKSGTSYIYSILRQHSRIAAAEKDTQHLVKLLTDGPDTYLVTYVSHASNKYRNEAILADFDVGYSIHCEGAALISRILNPDARILICLRDPVQRAVSEYGMRARQHHPEFGSFVETHDFFDAIALETERERQDPLHYKHYYAYTARGRYWEQIKPYFDAFGREKVLVAIFEEDVVGDPSLFLLKTFWFLGLDDEEAAHLAFTDHSELFRISRSPKEINIRLETAGGEVLAGEVLDLDLPMDLNIKRVVITSDVPEQLDLTLEIPSASTVEAAVHLKRRHSFRPTAEESAAIYKELYAQDVARLEDLLQRDLSCWTAKYE